MNPTRLEFSVAFEADQGARSYQEDSVQVWRPNGSAQNRAQPVLAVLADGMGGHVAGEKASQLAIARYVDNFASGKGNVAQLLEHSLFASNDGISTEIRKNPALGGMGCTLVAAYVDQDGLRWASVGDSSLLLYHQQLERNYILSRLNEDHSVGALLDKQADAKLISYEDAKNDPRRRTLRSALTGGPIAVQEIVSDPEPLYHGDWIIVASDGLETLRGNEIAQIIGRHREYGEPADVVRDLLAEVRKKASPHQDNISIVAIKVVDPLSAETRILAQSPANKSANTEPVTQEMPSSARVNRANLSRQNKSNDGSAQKSGVMPTWSLAGLVVLMLTLGIFVLIGMGVFSTSPTSTPTGIGNSSSTGATPPGPSGQTGTTAAPGSTATGTSSSSTTPPAKAVETGSKSGDASKPASKKLESQEKKEPAGPPATESNQPKPNNGGVKPNAGAPGDVPPSTNASGNTGNTQ
jgi:PPM family protein phosphatase